MALPKMVLPRWFSTLCKSWFIQELWCNVKLFIPLALGFVLSHLGISTSLVFCGHYPKDTALVLEGAGLAYSIMNITGFLVMFGMGAAMDTLAAQAYGAGSYKKVGVYLQRGILIHALGLLLVLGFWANLESILNLLHQPPCVVKYTVLFVQGFAFSLPAILSYYLLQKYLQAQGIVYPFIVSEAAAMVVNVLGHYLLMFVADLGILGAGIALGISQYAALLFLLGLIWIRKLHKETWGGWSLECLNDWGQYTRYSIPGLFITIAESGSYEVGMLVVGLTGSLQQGIYAVLFNYAFLLFMVTYALRLTASIRVGNELGAGNPKGAKRAMFVGLCIALIWLAIIEVVTLGLKDYIPMIYTSDPTVLNAINVHFYVVAASIFCDTLHSFLAGTIIGCGWQHVGAVLNVLWYWFVGAPVGVSLTLAVQLGALGYWIGQATAGFLLVCSYIVVMAVMNWKKRSEMAQKMATLHYKEEKDRESVSSSRMYSDTTEEMSSNNGTAPKPRNNATPNQNSKDADATKETSSGNNVAIPKASSNAPPEQNTIKNPQEKSYRCPAREPKRECPLMDCNPTDKSKNTMFRLKIVIVRILTAAPFIILCVGAVVISQILVYHPNPCNTTITSNYSECLPLDGPQSELFPTMSTSVPICTSHTGAVTTLNHLLEPTPTFTPKTRASSHF